MQEMNAKIEKYQLGTEAGDEAYGEELRSHLYICDELKGQKRFDTLLDKQLYQRKWIQDMESSIGNNDDPKSNTGQSDEEEQQEQQQEEKSGKNQKKKFPGHTLTWVAIEKSFLGVYAPSDYWREMLEKW